MGAGAGRVERRHRPDDPASPRRSIETRKPLCRSLPMTDYLVDTNILLRRVQPSSPQRPVVRQALRTLAGRGDRLCITAQNLHEFWYVATRSVARNGLGLTPAQTERKLHVLRGAFQFLPETPAIYAEWEELVTTLSIVAALS